MPSSSATLLYEQGDWSSLWWLPKPGKSATPGEQVAIAGESSQLPHLIFVPSGKPPSTSGWPLLVFLHGQGESSPEDLSRVALQGPPQQAGRMPQHMPFAVLSPQKPLHAEFFSPGVARSIIGLMDHYIRALHLDSSRVYLTGVSQGGIGAWGLSSDPKYASRFAAVAPICGGLLHARKAAAATLADTPVWAFHGANDAVVPVQLSDESVAAVNAHAARTTRAGQAKYTRIEQARSTDLSWVAAGIPEMEGHASWVDAYYPLGTTRVGHLEAVPLYQWLLSHTRPQAITSSS